jgi:hypothetical protein
MAKVTLDFGQTWDILTKHELSEALAEDARLRAIVAGVKPVEMFLGTGILGAAATIFSTSGGSPQAPANGYLWAVMQIAVDLSASAALNVYKGTPAAAAAGSRPVMHNGNANVQIGSFSKGQVWMRPGDQFTFIPASGNLLSIFMTAIEVPAERVGELLI